MRMPSDLAPRAWGLLACFLITAFLALASAPGFAQGSNAPAESATSLDSLKIALDEVETALGREDAPADTLADLRQSLNATSDTIRAKIEELQPRAGEVEARLKQLGAPPAPGAPPEASDVTDEREQLNVSFAELDGALKQARLLSVRADQLSERLSEKRHALYARELFARTPSVLDPYFWIEAGRAVPVEWGRLAAVLSYWRSATLDKAGALQLAAAAGVLLGILAIAFAVTRWWLPRFDAGPRADTHFARARTAFWVFVWLSARTPLAVLAAVLTLEGMGLLTMRLAQIADGLAAAVFAASFGRAVARALFAPDKLERRLVRLDNGAALTLHNHLIWMSRAFGGGLLLQVFHKALNAPLIITVATNALFAAAVAAGLLSVVMALRRAQQAEREASPPVSAGAESTPAGEVSTTTAAEGAVAVPGLYPAALLFSTMIILALLAGFAAAAAFIALRVVVGAAVLGALYLLLVVTRALFAGFGENTRRGRALAANLGVSPRGVDLASTLLSAVVRVLLIVFACLPIIGPWEVSTADLFDTVRNIPFGFKIGEINVSLRAVLGALFSLALLLGFTRVAQRWLETELLPRTALEPSLRVSIGTMFGYLGVIAAIAIALGALGIDLQKIALVAGALSVGIGFGLQSIVSNFVSGLILLAERPIRIGDSIVVKGEEGKVRRVRVRATEIETGDRATVIIPNSELITGVVKNRTHPDTSGPVIIKIGVAYDTDPEQLSEVLTEIAKRHPQVMAAPPPAAFLVAFGGSALEFELRCTIPNLDLGLSVKSELQHAILKRFRELGIEMPYPQHEIRWRGPETGPDGKAEIVPLGRAAGQA